MDSKPRMARINTDFSDRDDGQPQGDQVRRSTANGREGTRMKMFFEWDFPILGIQLLKFAAINDVHER
jgi:hypothetical protein